MPRIDPAEQRLDEPVDDGLAEPGADVVTDGDVVVECTAGPGLLGAQSVHLVGGEHAQRRGRVGGDAHEGGGRHRAQAPPAPDRRRRGRRGHELSLGTDAGDEVGGLGANGQHRLRADVDEVAAHGIPPQLAAEVGAALEDRDVG